MNNHDYYDEDDMDIYNPQIPPWTEQRGCWGCLIVVAVVVVFLILTCLS